MSFEIYDSILYVWYYVQWGVLLSNGGPFSRSCYPAGPVAMCTTWQFIGLELRLLMTVPFSLSLQVRVYFPCVLLLLFCLNLILNLNLNLI